MIPPPRSGRRNYEPELQSQPQLGIAEKRSSPRRTRSPQFKSDLTDYRISSNHRTIRTYNEPTRQSLHSDSLPIRQSTYGAENLQQTRRKRSPGLRQEPTVYREATNYRTVRAYESPSVNLTEKKESERPLREPQSEIKKPEEKAEVRKSGR